jgi:hypothetical protein
MKLKGKFAAVVCAVVLACTAVSTGVASAADCGGWSSSTGYHCE